MDQDSTSICESVECENSISYVCKPHKLKTCYGCACKYHFECQKEKYSYGQKSNDEESDGKEGLNKNSSQKWIKLLFPMLLWLGTLMMLFILSGNGVDEKSQSTLVTKNTTEILMDRINELSDENNALKDDIILFIKEKQIVIDELDQCKRNQHTLSGNIEHKFRENHVS